MFETYNKSYIFQNLVWMRKDDHLVVQDVQMAQFVASPAARVIQPVQMIDVRMRKDVHVVVRDVQLAPFVASPAVRVIQPVQMIDVRMRKDDHQWDEKHVQMGKFIAPIQAHAPYLKNVELAKPSD